MTKRVTVNDAKTHLLQLLTFAMKGNEVIITEDNKPLARLVPAEQPKKNKSRVAGLNKGKIWIDDDFDKPLSDEFWTNSK